MAGLKEALEGALTKEELGFLRKSFDVVGSVAIIEIPKELKKKEKIVAKKILEMNNSIKTVAKKEGAHKGRYRVQKLRIITGEKNKTAEYKESGVRIKLNVEKCYFSPRLSNERLRIASQIKKKENILVMFSGVAPYPLVIAKNSQAENIVGIELNPLAHKFALENIALNKLEKKIKVYKGDVKKIIKKLKIRKFDRIIMPLPKGAKGFLKEAFYASKKGAIIHYYTFAKENEFEEAEKELISECKKLNKKCRILRTVKAGQTSPREFRICIDFMANI